MKSLVMALMALPFMAGAAAAAQPLNDAQMDGVTAGFTALSTADAEGLVGESGVVLTTTASLSQVNPAATATEGETFSILYKSLSAAQSSTITSLTLPAPIPSLTP
jgi:pectate lyase